jgi:hypothetical protein
MAENGTNNGKQSAQERNERGQFVKGNKGGPGRSNTSKQLLSMDDIEGALQKGLKSADAKIRHSATRLLLMLKKLQGDRKEKRKGILSPVIEELLQHVTRQQDAEEAEFEVVDSEGQSSET